MNLSVQVSKLSKGFKSSNAYHRDECQTSATNCVRKDIGVIADVAVRGKGSKRGDEQSKVQLT
jgi:hypothetical protein